MKKTGLVIIASLILAGSMHVDEWARVPFLIQHYSEHRQQNTSYSFLAFIYKHYVANKTGQSAKDHQRHSQLPYQSAENTQSHFTAFILTVYHYHLSVPLVSVPRFYYRQRVPASLSYDIWQPPKVG